jgi:hypothetical protein
LAALAWLKGGKDPDRVMAAAPVALEAKKYLREIFFIIFPPP